MIGPMHLAQSGTFNGFNPLFCPCHCDKDEDDIGGSEFTEDSTSGVNPFMKLKPVPVDTTDEGLETYDTIHEQVNGQTEFSSKAIFKMLNRLDGKGNYPVLTEEQRIAFNDFLLKEEEDFALLLLLADEECYEC